MSGLFRWTMLVLTLLLGAGTPWAQAAEEDDAPVLDDDDGAEECSVPSSRAGVSRPMLRPTRALTVSTCSARAAPPLRVVPPRLPLFQKLQRRLIPTSDPDAAHA